MDRLFDLILVVVALLLISWGVRTSGISFGSHYQVNSPSPSSSTPSVSPVGGTSETAMSLSPSLATPLLRGALS